MEKEDHDYILALIFLFFFQETWDIYSTSAFLLQSVKRELTKKLGVSTIQLSVTLSVQARFAHKWAGKLANLQMCWITKELN